jgi:hypothetical protein
MPTAERTQELKNFVLVYKTYISMLESIGDIHIYNRKWRAFIDGMVRTILPYSNKTCWIDIRRRLIREHRRITRN